MSFLRRLFGRGKQPPIEETLDVAPRSRPSIPSRLVQYLPRFTEPFWRKQSALFYSLEQQDQQALIQYASEEFNVPIVPFEDIIEAAEQRDIGLYLEQYKDSGIIIPDVYRSSETHDSKQIDHVFEHMRAEEAMQGIPFYMFTAENTSNIKQNWRFNYHHPMYNWNMFVDLSEL